MIVEVECGLGDCLEVVVGLGECLEGGGLGTLGGSGLGDC